jgi:hypothetical protein
MFKSWSDCAPGEYCLTQDAVADVAGYPTVDHVEDGEFYGVEGTEYQGELLVIGGGGPLIEGRLVR